MWFALVLLACRGDDVAPSGDTSAGGGPEHVPGAAMPALDAPATATLDCASAPQDGSKTDCSLAFHWPDGTPGWAGTAGVTLHGRSSLDFPKKQYAVELRDGAGQPVDVDLFGMGGESDWLLNGMYIDRLLMRNRLAFDLWREATDDREWAPETVYVELTYDGAYHGVYALTERIDRDGGRLDFAAGDGTGSRFIVKADEGGTVDSTLQYGDWTIEYPPTDAQTAEVIDGVTEHMQAVEALLISNDPSLWQVADMDSLVAFVLLEEALKNNDGFFLSHHAYVGDDGKLRWVPWDLDLTLGQPLYNDNTNPDTWLAYRSDLVGYAVAMPDFRERMVEMWAEWRAGPFADDAFLARLGRNRALLGDAIDRNFEVWPIESIQFFGDQLPTRTSYEDEVAAVEAFAVARFAFLDANLSAY